MERDEIVAVIEEWWKGVEEAKRPTVYASGLTSRWRTLEGNHLFCKRVLIFK